MHPLSGITVIALEHAVAAPFCTRQLAELGARVIKIERPGGGDFARALDERTLGLSSHFVWANRSKESITLNIKHPEAKTILAKLLEKTDVLVQNLAPGATAKLGLTHELLQPAYPRLIVCDISGYGLNGPCKDKKAYDLLIQGESGFLSITGTAEEPVKAGCAIADISAGMYAYSSILASLIQRGKTGKGCHIDISMLESMVEWMGHPLYYAFDNASPPPRTGASHATISPYGPYVASDGKTIILGLQNEREWESFCRNVLERPDLIVEPCFASNSDRVAARDKLALVITEVFSKLTSAQIIGRLDAAKIANARMNDMNDVWEHPQLKARNRWRRIETPKGVIPALLPPGVSEKSVLPMGSIPAIGQHTDAVLQEVGYGLNDINRLRTDGVI